MTTPNLNHHMWNMNSHATDAEERGFLAVSLEIAARLARALAKGQGQPKHGGVVTNYLNS